MDIFRSGIGGVLAKVANIFFNYYSIHLKGFWHVQDHGKVRIVYKNHGPFATFFYERRGIINGAVILTVR